MTARQAPTHRVRTRSGYIEERSSLTDAEEVSAQFRDIPHIIEERTSSGWKRLGPERGLGR